LELRPWSATLTENFLKGTYDAFRRPGTSQLRKVGNYDVWNLSASYAGLAGWRLSAGIKNLFDRDPPFTNQTFSASTGGPAGYDPTYANPIGRVFWAALAYRFN
jgi:iron complex outermembrane receptor protein